MDIPVIDISRSAVWRLLSMPLIKETKYRIVEFESGECLGQEGTKNKLNITAWLRLLLLTRSVLLSSCKPFRMLKGKIRKQYVL